MDARKVFAAGVLGLAAGVAATPAAEPAARLRLAAHPPVARGLAPESTPPRSGDWMTGPTGPTVRPLSPAGVAPTRGARPVSTVSTPPARPSLLLDTWAEMKQAVAGQPSAAPAVKPTAPVPPAPPAVPTQSPGVYAGPPAYRWYGYGTVSPAPAAAGPAPRGSANWLTQTGATPGAFPATAGGRPAETLDVPPPTDPVGNDAPPPPAYHVESAFPAYPPLPPGAVLVSEGPPVPVAGPAAPPAFTAPYPAPPVPAPVIVTPTPPPARKEVPANTVSTPPEPPPGGLIYPPPTAVGVPISAAPAPPPALAWQPSGAAETVAFTQSRPTAPPMRNPDVDTPGPQDIVPVNAVVPAPVAKPVPPAAEWVPVGRGQLAAPKPTIKQETAAAADGLATVTDATFTSSGKLVVKLTAATEGDARAAAAAIGKLPQLKPVAVEFVATVGGR